MNYKEIIKNYKSKENSIKIKIEELNALYSNGDKLWIELDKLKEDFFLNPKMINFFADSLQMVNDDERLASFDLFDIKEIYSSLVQYYPDNIQYHIDLISFVNDVLGDENEAIELINNAIAKIDINKKKLIALLGDTTTSNKDN